MLTRSRLTSPRLVRWRTARTGPEPTRVEGIGSGTAVQRLPGISHSNTCSNVLSEQPRLLDVNPGSVPSAGLGSQA